MADRAIELLPLCFGDTWLALDATLVIEVLGAQPWVPLPGALPHAPGVISWRGRAIAIVDLGAIAGVAPALERGQVRPRTLVATAAGVSFGIPVDGAREVQRVAPGAVTPLHAASARGARGEVALLGMVMPVFDLERAVAELAGAP